MTLQSNYWISEFTAVVKEFSQWNIDEIIALTEKSMFIDLF